MTTEPTREQQIRQTAEWMIEQGYIERSFNTAGQEIWTITEKGRDYYATLQEHTED